MLDDPFGGGSNPNNNETSTFGGYNNDFRGIIQQPNLNKGYSAPPMGGLGAPSYTRSQYTGSEIGDSEYDTHSQLQNNRRKQWGNPAGGGVNTQESNYGRDLSGIDDPFKNMGGGMQPPRLNLGGLGDLAGVTQIETLDLGQGSRRGSFSKPRNEVTGRASDSKERNPINTSAIGIPRPNTGPSFDGAGFKRPQTSEAPDLQGMISGAYSLGGGGGGGILVQDRNYDNIIRKSNNPYSEVASSYKDDDDALSHYMG